LHVTLCLQVYCQDCGLKMCREVSEELHSAPELHMQGHRVGPCCYKDWTRPAPNSATEGLIQGIGGLVHELKEGVSDLVYDPVHGIYKSGWSGAAAGLSSGLNSLLSRPLAGGSVLLNKVKEGIRASLASHLSYGVTTSSVDPMALSRSASDNSDDMPRTSKLASDPSVERIRRLKFSIPELPPVLEIPSSDPVTPVGLQSPSAPLTPMVDLPTTTEVLSATSRAPSVRSWTGARPPLYERDVTTATFYSAKQGPADSFEDATGLSDVEEGDGEGNQVSDDGSVYGEDDEGEALPFVLCETEEAACRQKVGSPTVLTVSPSTPAGSPQVVLSPVVREGRGDREDKPSGVAKVREQITTQINNVLSLVGVGGSTTSVAEGSKGNDSSDGSSVQTLSGISAPLWVHTTRLAGVTATRLADLPESRHRATTAEAYRTAVMAQQLFGHLGARNKR
jgi:hypothetical protein